MSDQTQTELETIGTKEVHFVFYEATRANPRHHDRNEDALFTNGRDSAMVLDGAGGVVSGDAARAASQSALHFMRDNLSGKKRDEVIAEEHLRNVIAEASRTVRAEAGGGLTTAVVARIVENRGVRTALIASVGDSRAYLLRDGQLEKITEDDYGFVDDPDFTLETAQRLDNAKSENDLSPDQLKYFKTRNIMSRALGQESPLNVHIQKRRLMQGDKLLLTTDGVHDNLTTSEIEDVMLEDGDVAQKLVQKAYVRSQQNHFRSKMDDISAVAINVS